ncbi:PREDICTED: UDP-N-acetylglucosamine--dolichyl-phosphate N-acetylglucosaminephosphotransferase [Theobroma cacao]|uniref:UDP-N-acetylglucosamine--dolichyl-phosphate N-acetylglucosaminephosphotransferase n=2 Tax=Theobroma cacao TaxID=3641 RepID=A0A061EVJ5_THECC|nr:PREDICTED: UDP-N-acetylglucosamine--dolichyl-phosphate N-acetylglucosaminephosphotransferase [Theobroma cacao]EOY09110.1 UDP-glcnac-adolichol phosphate glcnac-1-p-transferase [Theobroma cacao]
MAARKRASATTATPTETKPNPPLTQETTTQTDPPISPPKKGLIFKLCLFFSISYFYLLFQRYKIEQDLKRSILINAALSVAGFFLTQRMIPVASRYVLKRNLFGFDINKKGTPQGTVKVPESLGIVVGIVFLVLAILFQYFNFTADSNWLVEYNAALASICFMILLGFVDDVLDVPWRVKLLLPSIAALPLLMAYAGHTTIIIPKPLVSFVGLEVLDLGCVYKLYMGLLAVFCTNSINIHAGLNGLEVGQTVVIASAILIHNIMQIGASSDPEYKQAHAFSIYLVQPLLATSLALLSYNWYPSSVFVGDTYTYFAGMTMAVVGILGHYSETLLIFFLPQVLNFLLSLPQLSGYVKCPRHRLPRFNPETGLLTGTHDGTLVNFYLRIVGPKSEKSLCLHLLFVQALGCCFCFMLRYFLAGWYK